MATDLQEALTAAGASALIQKQIDPMLLEYMRRYAPIVRAIPTVKWGSNVYFFNRRDSLPAGGFVTDGGARPVTTSVYNQASFTIRQFQTVGAVTGYAEAVTADLIGSLRAKEIAGAHQGLLWDIETAIMSGNSGSTLNGPYPQFDGMDTIFSTFSGATQNAINFSDGNFDLGVLDQLIDLVEQNVAMPVESTDWMFVVSPTVNSRVAQLLTNQQRYTEVEIAPGLIVASYRNVPLVKTSFLNPRSNTTGTLSSSAGGSGSAFAGGQIYYYKISAVVNRFAELQPSSETSVTPSAGQNVTLSFTPPTGPDNGSPNLYKVFRGTTSGSETLLGYVDANVAIASDGVTPIVTNNIVDTGGNLIPQNSTGPTQPATLSASAYTGTNAGVLPLASGDMNLYLISRDSDNIVRPYVRDLTPVDIYPTTASPDSLPFAIVSDCTFAVRAPKYGARAANVNVTLAS